MPEGQLQTPGPMKRLPNIQAIWERTDMPETLLPLPLGVTIDVNQSLLIRGKREGTFLPDAEFTHIYEREQIIEVQIYLMPDVPDDTDCQWIHEADQSIAILRIVDPYEVVESFELVFTSPKSYYFKALAQGLRRQGIKVSIEEETPQSRKLRYLRQSQNQ